MPALLLCRDVLHSNALPWFDNIMLRQRCFRDINVTHETVTNHDFLRSAFANVLRFTYHDSVDELALRVTLPRSIK